MSSKYKNTISACLVLHNEEGQIERCLKSLKDEVDEIVVVLDGPSQDRTEEICNKYGAKIFVEEHIGMSDSHFVFAFNQAKSNWILKIDADEYLSDGLRSNLKSLVQTENIAAYKLLWPLFDGSKYITHNKPHKLVLFRKDKIGYLGVPHGKFVTYGPIAYNDLRLEHRPNNNKWSWAMFIKKQLPWIKHHAQILLKDFEQIPRYRIEQNDWDWRDNLRRRHSYLFLLFGTYAFFRGAMLGEWRNRRALKVSFFNGLYESLLSFYILKSKIKNIIRK